MDENTGGGGAKRWTHSDDLSYLRELLGTMLGIRVEKLPRKAGLNMAICRTSRVLDRLLEPVEDVGVKSDIRWRLTKRDLQEQSCDLLNAACETLRQLPTFRLTIEEAKWTPAGISVCASTTPNIDRLVCSVDGVPEYVLHNQLTAAQAMQQVATFESEFVIPYGKEDRGEHALELQGYASKEKKPVLVASNRFVLPAATMASQSTPPPVLSTTA